MLGGEIIARMLKEEGVEKVFGIIDGTYFGFYATLRNYGIELITPRHETTAAHMAGAYARLTGKLGVCMASNGPGVANILPGITVENAEGNRVLIITSKRRPQITDPDRGGAYQIFEQSATIKHISKWSETVAFPERIPEMMRMAFREVWKGRPGVVHLDVPETIMNSDTKEPVFWKPNQYRNLKPVYPDPEQVKKAAKLLIESKIPMIQAGTGVIHAGASAELEELADLIKAPVMTSMGGRTSISERSRYSVPVPQVVVSMNVRTTADVALVLGSRIGETDWWGKPIYWKAPFEQKTIQVDIDESMLGINKPMELGIVADIKTFLRQLIDEIKKDAGKMNIDERDKLIDSYNAMKTMFNNEMWEKLKDESVPMLTAHVPVICRETFNDDAICVVDGGNTAVWANFYQDFPVPNTMMTTFKFGMLGAGVAHTLGASAAFPGRQVYCIIGDGAMGFHPQEIETAVRNGMKPVYIVVADRQWGMVKLTQELALDAERTTRDRKLPDDELINTDLKEIEWDKLAESMGAFGARAQTPDELKKALKDAIASDKCAVIYVSVDPVEHKWPPGIMAFKEMHNEPQG